MAFIKLQLKLLLFGYIEACVVIPKENLKTAIMVKKNIKDLIYIVKINANIDRVRIHDTIF
jgi:Leu/Phe-tRNA-protein transferase